MDGWTVTSIFVIADMFRPLSYTKKRLNARSLTQTLIQRVATSPCFSFCA